jgi:formylglycine-generating enzyme required for sulfatase activity
MKTVKLKHLCFLIIICESMMNILPLTFVHGAQTTPGVVRLGKGIEYYESGKYEEAIFNFEMAKIQISEDDKESLWEVHFYSGLSYCLTGDKDEAKEEFIKANEILNGRLPDLYIHSPKIVEMFKDTFFRTGTGLPGIYTGSIAGMELVLVKGGCFKMGNNFGDGYDDEKTVHDVCVDDYYIGKYEVTQGQWEEVMGNNPSGFKSGSNYPVESVSWNDVRGFIRKLNNKTGKTYRLPTEAEWEYAARSGGEIEKWAGTSAETELEKYAWFDINTGGKTHPVGRKASNGFGICDMSGNVCEWCQDIYNNNAYMKHSRYNPVYTDNSSFRVIRGGSWVNSSRYLRVSKRSLGGKGRRGNFLGFRLARNAD